MASSFSIESFCKSDIGLRDNNEDVFKELPKQHFYILADGMGGHAAGEVAASRAVEYMCSAIQNLLIKESGLLHLDEVESHLGALIENTNLWVHHLGMQNPDLRGMGTTLCTILFYKNFIIYSHVGDSRIYRLRDKCLTPLTKDHLINKTSIQQNTSTIYYPQKVLTRAVGTMLAVNPEIGRAVAEPGDLYLMCSDGLSDLVSDFEIKNILTKNAPLSEMGDELIHKAIKSGGRDNITLVLTRLT